MLISQKGLIDITFCKRIRLYWLFGLYIMQKQQNPMLIGIWFFHIQISTNPSKIYSNRLFKWNTIHL